MSTQMKKEFSRIVSFIVTVCFVSTGVMPVKAVAMVENDHLRPQAAKLSPRGQDISRDISRGSLRDGGAASVLVLGNMITLLEGAQTGGYNVEHAISDGANGGIFNHSEPRQRLEVAMQNLLMATRDLINQGAAETTIKDNWVTVLKTANLSAAEIDATIPLFGVFRYSRKDKVLIDFVARQLVNGIVNAQLKTMIKYADRGGFRQTVLCAGETRPQYDAKLTEGVIEQDLREMLEGISAEDTAKIGLRIAYEPRWAINQKIPITPTSVEIQSTHRFIKDTVKQIMGVELEVDYGGSLNDKNCAEILALSDVNGGLIGGAAKETAKIGVVIDEAARIFETTGKKLNVGMNWKAEDGSTKLEPLSNFVSLFKTKDLSKVRVVISTPQVKVVGAAMAQLDKDMALSGAKAEALVARLEKSLKDPAARKLAIAEIEAVSPVIKDFMDLFLIKETGRIDAEQLAALKSRLTKVFNPEKAATRIAVYGANSVSRIAIREIVQDNYDNLELVTVIGKPIDELVPFIVRDSQQGMFNGRAVTAKDLLYLGDQAQAVRIFNEKDFTSATRAMPWSAFGLDIIIIDEDAFARIGKDVKDAFAARGIKVVISRKAGDGYITYVPGISDEAEVAKAAQVTVAATPVTASVLGTQILGGIGKIQFVSPAVVQPWYDQVPPTYKIPGSYQTGHTEDRSLSNPIVDVLHIDSNAVARTSVIKTQVSHGQMIELTVGVSGTVTKDEVIGAFKKFAATSDVLGLPEKGVVLSSNIVWGDKKILFSPDGVYVKPYNGGTEVKALLFIDEDVAHVDHILKVASGASAKKEAAQTAGVQEEYASSAFMALQAEALKDKNDKEAVEKKAKAAAKAKELADAKAALLAAGKVVNEKTLDAFKYLTAGMGTKIGLLKSGKEIVGVVSYENGLIVASSLLTPPSLEAIQDTLIKYYSALRDFALTQSFKNKNAEIEVIDVYRPEAKLRVRFGVSAASPAKTMYKSVDQLIAGNWVVISEPNTVINPADFNDKYVSVVNGAGGRIGSLWVRAASEKKHARIIAMGGPTAQELAAFLDKGDTVQGRFEGTIKSGTDWIELNGKRSIVFSSRAAKTFREPENYPWGTFLFAGVRVNVAVDATGQFTTGDQLGLHRQAGALRGWVTAPGSGPEFKTRTFVMNINHDNYNSSTDYVGSTASCTTGCLAMLNRIMEVAMALESGKLDAVQLYQAKTDLKRALISASITKDMKLPGLMTTYHALTEEGLKADEVANAKNATRKRNASDNILPTKTGAAAAIGDADQATTELDGYALRFPTDVGSLVIPTYVIEGSFTKDEIIAAGRIVEEVARGVKLQDVNYSGQIKLIKELRTMMATISPEKTDVINFVNDQGQPMTMVKLPGWYENEKYYALEAVDFNHSVMRKKENAPRLVMGRDGRLSLGKPVNAKDGGAVSSAVPYIKDLKRSDIQGHKVLIRVDFNVLDDTGKIKSRKRIKEAIPTLKALEGATVILMSHNGRPKGAVMPALSMAPVAKALEEELKENNVNFAVNFIEGSINEDGLAEGVKEKIVEGAINVLENTRFFKGEEKNDENFSRKLADLADNYAFVFDAFGTAERLHSSTGGCARFMQKIAFGYLMEKEDRYLDEALQNLYGLIIGGGPKVSEKVPVVENVIPNIAPGGFLIIGTGPAPAFLYVMHGIELGQKPSAQDIKDAKKILRRCAKYGVRVILPVDYVCCDTNITVKDESGKNAIDKKELPKGAAVYRVTLEQLKQGTFSVDGKQWNAKDSFIYDAADESSGVFDAAIKQTPNGKSVFYNGQPGVEEIKEFSTASKAIGKSLVEATWRDGVKFKDGKIDLSGKNGISSVVGGGDTTKSAEKTKIEITDDRGKVVSLPVADLVTHSSTGGGASAAKLKGEPLQVQKALRDIQGNLATSEMLGIDKAELTAYKAAGAKVYEAQAGSALSAYVAKVGGTMAASGDTAIAELRGEQILDSRGKPTVRAVLTINGVTTIGEVPAGASKGEDEARTVGAEQAIKNINDVILPMIKESGMDLRHHEDLVALEKMIIGKAGDNFKDLGADSTVPVSWALWMMAAKLNNLELDQYIAKNEPEAVGDGRVLHYMNIFNGGLHALKPGEKLGVDRNDIQEIMIVPQADSQAASLKDGDASDQSLKAKLTREFGADRITRADEFGFSVKGLGDNYKSIEDVKNAAEEAGVKVWMALDFAASSYYNVEEKVYEFGGRKLTSDQMVEEIIGLVRKYPGLILSLEDALAENDWDGWMKLTAAMKELGVETIGDDLFVTQLGRLNQGIEMGAATAILIKVNQNGSVYGTIEVIKRARQAGMKYVVSHRSGETLFAGIADLAAGTKAFGLKTGDPQPLVDVTDKSQLVRRAKYERMVAIEQRDNARQKYLIVAPEFFALGGVRNDLMQLARLNGKVSIATYGAKANELKALTGNAGMIIAKDVSALRADLEAKGAKAGDMIVVRSTKDEAVSGLKQVVAGDLAALALAKATTALINTEAAADALAGMYEETMQAGVISRDDYAKTKDAFLASLESGTFEFPEEIKATDQIAQGIEEMKLVEAEFVDRV